MARQTINIDEIISEAQNLTQLRKEIGPRLNKARQVLTFLDESGLLSDEQHAVVTELFATQGRVQGVRMMDPKTKQRLDRPVYSKVMGPELEGKPVSDEDMASLFGENWLEQFPNAYGRADAEATTEDE